MKKLITALSVLTLGTTVGNLSSALNTNQKMESVNNILNQGNKKISNNLPLASITKNNISNSLTQSDLKTLVAGGENYYKYYFAYHVISLSHKVLQDINNALGAGVGAVAAILSAVIPAIAPIVAVVAALIIAQWTIWQIPQYDNGNGVVIEMVGFTPTWIVNVSAQ